MRVVSAALEGAERRLTWLDQYTGEGRRCSMTSIEIRGARTHNLKGIDVDVPKHRLVAFTGVSGSGKSSLVFDTICTKAQRQLVETFSTYARRRLPQLTRPPVDAIRNISPCIVIDQKRLGASSRSTIGTVTEIYTYLRMLFSRCGRPFVGWSHRFSFNHPDGMCPACKGLFTAAERERLLWSDDVRIEKVHQGATHERTFEGVARKLERLHVDKDEDQIPRAGKEAYRRLFTERACPDCGGVRLNAAARAVELAGGWTVGRLVDCELTQLDRPSRYVPTRRGGVRTRACHRRDGQAASRPAIHSHPCRLTPYGADAGHRAGAMDYALARARLPALRTRPHRPERRLGVRVFSGRFAHAGTAVARGAHRVCPNPGAVAARSAAQTQRPRGPLRPPPRPAPAALDAESRRVAQDRPFPRGARRVTRRTRVWTRVHDRHHGKAVLGQPPMTLIVPRIAAQRRHHRSTA